jgi:hypothetical protein
MGTKTNPGQFDCYAKAEPDEPMFTLLARDKHAPTLIWLWSVLRELDEEDAAKVAEARKLCSEMIQWAYDHGRPIAGIGQAALAAVLELIRSTNHAVKESMTTATDIDAFRLFLCKTEFEPENSDQPSSEAQGESQHG